MLWRLLLVFLIFTSIIADCNVSALKETESGSDDDCKDCFSPKITQHPRNHTVIEFDRIQLKCKVAGNPPPTVGWMNSAGIINPKGISGIREMFNEKKLVSKLIIERVKIKDADVYTCFASNKLGFISSHASVLVVNKAKPVVPPTPWIQPTLAKPKGNRLCMRYTNKTCSNVLDPKLFISVQSLAHFLYTEKQLQQTYKTISVQYSASPSCQPYVLPLLCHHNFPYCSTSSPGAMKLICRSACNKLQEDICHSDYLAAKQDQYMRDLLPTCENLPSNDCLSLEDLTPKIITTPKPTSPLKIATGNIAVPQTDISYSDAVDQDDNCFIGGDDYRGIVNVTISNIRCKHWNRLLTRAYREKEYPRLTGHNYCRNPDGQFDRPWCFIDTNGKEQSEYCDIPKCILPAKVEVISILWTIIPCLIFALALSLAIILVAWRRQKHHMYLSPGPPPVMTMMPKIPSKINELKREDICALRLFGDGSFGSVYAGEYVGSVNGRPATKVVAVKVLMDKGSPCQTQDFLHEAETMARFKHENVASLLGSISKDGPLCLVYEYSEFGDLHEYLLLHSPNFSGAHTSGECEPLDCVDLLAIGVQIAKGMDYLASQSFVHRDLATRNCFVNDNGIVKISWFSGLRDVYAGDYYRVHAQPPLPVRWMAPESLDAATFTSASDVWAFGVTLWEVFSYGLQPHFGFCNQEVVVRIRSGCKLPCPENCPQRVHTIMLDSWNIQPESRPTFQQLVARLLSLSKNGTCGRSTRVSNGHASGRPDSVSPSVASSHSIARMSNGIGSSIRSHPSAYGVTKIPSPISSLPPSNHSMTQSMMDCHISRGYRQPINYDHVDHGHGHVRAVQQMCPSHESSIISYQPSLPSCGSSCRSCNDRIPCEPKYFYT